MVKVEAISRLPVVLKSISDEQGANAAVALLLKPRINDFDLLLVKRVKKRSDPWSGQMALPGGKREPEDKSLSDTIIRETLEEIGVDLRQHRFLGVLDAVKTKPNPIFKILPFVVLLEKELALNLNKAELENYIWVPFKDFIQSKGEIEMKFEKVPAFLFADAIVWGVTYEILIDFDKVWGPSRIKNE